MKNRIQYMVAFGLLAMGLTASWSPQEASAEVPYALKSASVSLSTAQAGAHADLTTSFEVTGEEEVPAGQTRNVSVDLPPGAIGNPQGIPRCTSVQLGSTTQESECPIATQVGVTTIALSGELIGTLKEPIYNMEPPGGDVVARFGFFAGPYPIFLDLRVDPVDYGLIATIEGAASAAGLLSAKTTFWGVPAAPVHDPFRITPVEAETQGGPPEGRESPLPEAPFLTNPTSCGIERTVSITASSYGAPDDPSTLTVPFPEIVGCEKVNFEPSLSVLPTNTEAAAPTGIDAELSLRQDETPQGRGTSPLKSAAVTLPEGLTINPAAADGLSSCSAAEVGFETAAVPSCPDAAKIGSAEIDVPALEQVLKGAVYQRTPEPGSLFRIWLVTDEQGVRLKLPAEIVANPITGQLQTVFGGIPALGGNPEVPIASLKLHVFGGPRAPLATPAACGTYSSHYEFEPWSGQQSATGDAPMTIDAGCGKGGFSPTLGGGVTRATAGQFSPFVLELTRNDGEANISAISVTLPEGLLAKLGGVPLCPDVAAATANCSATSLIGSVSAAAGVGGAPLWIPQPGRTPTAIYLAGPYKGAPYSLVIKVPAQAGPFDLGNVVTRAAIKIDPHTAQATVESDPLPQILEGVPIAYRVIRTVVDRPEFTVNPTDCDAARIESTVLAATGAAAHPSQGFQVANCANLGFSPKLQLTLRGAPKRSGNPSVKAVLTQPGGQAGIDGVTTILPKSLFIDNAHISNPCTRVQFNAGACPTKSVLGRARAWSPLLDQPLEGPVYFRSNGGERELPDLVADLGGPIHIVVVGFIDSVGKKGSESSSVRTRFLSVPDAPVSKFILQLAGGKRGVLENSVNLCRSPQRATVKMTGQNGKTRDRTQPMRIAACAKKGT